MNAFWTAPLTPAVLILFAAVPAAGAEAGLSIPLTVAERAGVERVKEPVTSGVPLPEGRVKDVAALRLFDKAGVEVHAGFQPAARWPSDGSVKWVHVTFQSSVPAGGRAEYRLGLGEKPANPGAAAPMVFVEGNKATIDTGLLQCKINGDRFNLLDGAWVDESGGQAFDEAHQVVAPGHDGGFRMISSFFGLPKNKTYTSWAAPGKLELLEDGLLRCVVKVSGRMTSVDDLEGPKDPVSYDCYIYAWRNWPALRVTYVFHVDKTEKLSDYVPLDGIYLDLPTKLSGALGAAFGRKGGAEKVPLAAAGDRAWLEVEDSSKARGGGKLKLAEFAPKAEKPRELGWARLASEKLSVNVGVKWFWHLAPKSLELSGDGRVRLGLWPNPGDEVRKVEAGHEKALFSEKEPRRGNWYTGMSKTHEILVAFGSKGAEAATAERQWAWLSERLRAEAPTAWYCQGSRAWGRLADSSPELFAEEELGAVQRYDKQMRDWLTGVILKRNDKVFGKWDCHNVFNWGDHVNYVDSKYDGDRSKAPQSEIHWDNGYYGFAHALIVQWARTGDPVFLEAAEAFATHIGDIDTVWWAPKAASGASRYCAGPMHITIYETKGERNPIYRSGTFNHFKLQEHFERYYILGDWQARDVGLRAGEFATSLGNSGIDWGQSRSLGHGLLALQACYLATGEKKYLDKAGAFAERVAADVKKGRRVKDNQWWMGGIALEGLRDYWELTGSPTVREALVALTEECYAKGKVDNSCIHAAAWLAAQKDDAAMRAKALERFKGTAKFKDMWGAVMGYGNNQRNTGYAVWYFTKDLPKKDPAGK